MGPRCLLRDARIYVFCFKYVYLVLSFFVSLDTTISRYIIDLIIHGLQSHLKLNLLDFLYSLDFLFILSCGFT